MKIKLLTIYSLPSQKNQVKLDTLKETINKGYSMCKKCNPK